MKLFSSEGREVMRAKADMTGKGSIKGSAEFVEIQFGQQKVVKITLTLLGNPADLKSGFHAVHIHEKADCSGEFKCAGGHFDPGPAGNSDPDVNHPFHAGDLPAIEIEEDGSGTLEAITTRVTLSEGPLSILGGEGTSLMVHGNPDPYVSGEHGSGISGGPRIACGIIEEA